MNKKEMKELENYIKEMLTWEVKDYKKEALLELKNISETYLSCSNIRAIVELYPSFNSIVFHIKSGEVMEILLHINIDVLKEKPETIKKVLKQLSRMGVKL